MLKITTKTLLALSMVTALTACTTTPAKQGNLSSPLPQDKSTIKKYGVTKQYAQDEKNRCQSLKIGEVRTTETGCVEKIVPMQHPDELVVIDVAPIDPPVVNVVYETAIIKTDGLFDFDRYQITNFSTTGYIGLKTFVAAVNKNPNVVTGISITGHTDRMGSDQYNYTLGLRRANTIKEVLVKEGIRVDPSKISVSSAGESQPVTKCGNLPRQKLIDCLAEDRRIELRIGYQKK